MCNSQEVTFYSIGRAIFVQQVTPRKRIGQLKPLLVQSGKIILCFNRISQMQPVSNRYDRIKWRETIQGQMWWCWNLLASYVLIIHRLSNVSLTLVKEPAGITFMVKMTSQLVHCAIFTLEMSFSPCHLVDGTWWFNCSLISLLIHTRLLSHFVQVVRYVWPQEKK